MYNYISLDVYVVMHMYKHVYSYIHIKVHININKYVYTPYIHTLHMTFTYIYILSVCVGGPNGAIQSVDLTSRATV